MSRLSFEEVKTSYLHANIEEQEDCIEIAFYKVNTANVSDALTGYYITTSGTAQNVVVNGYAGYSATNTTRSYETVGFRLCFENGFLKCFKRELSHTAIVSSNSVNIQEIPLREHTLTQCFPDEILSLGEEVTKVSLKKTVSLAKRKNIEVPTILIDDLPNVANSLFDWFTFPIIRELRLSSKVFCINHLPLKNYFAPEYKTLNFKELVEHYFGTSTKKMLVELWDFLLIIDELDVMSPQLFLASVFHFSSVIFKVFGFDYFYRSLDLAKDRGFVEIITEKGCRTLSKHISAKKFLNAAFEKRDGDRFYDVIEDTGKMIREYEDPTKIPNSLKQSFPNGLQVDFNFKTLQELHDKISERYTIIKAEADNKDIPVNPHYALLDGRESGGLKLVVPKKTSQLSVWGKELSICVASYGNRAASGDTLLLGVEKNGSITYCVEFKSTKIQRMLTPQFKIFEAKEAATDFVSSVVEPFPMFKKFIGPPPEGEYYYTPGIVQFRGSHNKEANSEDRATVIKLIEEWARDNLEPYRRITNIFYEEQHTYTMWDNGEDYHNYGMIVNNGA